MHKDIEQYYNILSIIENICELVICTFDIHHKLDVWISNSLDDGRRETWSPEL